MWIDQRQEYFWVSIRQLFPSLWRICWVSFHWDLYRKISYPCVWEHRMPDRAISGCIACKLCRKLLTSSGQRWKPIPRLHCKCRCICSSSLCPLPKDLYQHRSCKRNIQWNWGNQSIWKVPRAMNNDYQKLSTHKTGTNKSFKLAVHWVKINIISVMNGKKRPEPVLKYCRKIEPFTTPFDVASIISAFFALFHSTLSSLSVSL